MASGGVYNDMGHITLVVDDEPLVRKYITSILRREHLETVEAEDGAEGLRMVRELGAALDLIVSDIQMPNVDGVAFALAAKEAFPELPILLISGCGEAHADFDFLKKPFHPSTFLERVRSLRASTPR